MENFNIVSFQKNLLTIQDKHYKVFSSKILPSVEEDTIIGIRAPQLRKFVKKFLPPENYAQYLSLLPHKYHEENLIHAFLVSEMTDYAACLAEVKKFLPYVNNWASCDALLPKVFKQHLSELEPEIQAWLRSEDEYMIRFGLSMLLNFYFDEDFDTKYLDWAAQVRSKDYYAQMMAAWLFATALAKYFDETIGYLKNRRLLKPIHTKTIQKALESRSIPEERKEYLKTLRL